MHRFRKHLLQYFSIFNPLFELANTEMYAHCNAHIVHTTFLPLSWIIWLQKRSKIHKKWTSMKAFLVFGFVSSAEINRVRTEVELSVTVILACIAIVLHFLATMGHMKRMQWLKVKFIKLCIMSCRFFFQTMPGGNCYQNVKL